MKTLIQKLRLKETLFVLAGLGMTSISNADQASMNASLSQVVQQLQQLKPLLQEAINQEPAGLQSSIHLTSFIGPDGTLQNGALQDLEALQSGLIAIINQNQIDPRSYAPITGDYLGGAQ